jgi:hypothetical protein
VEETDFGGQGQMRLRDYEDSNFCGLLIQDQRWLRSSQVLLSFDILEIKWVHCDWR